MEEGWGVGVKRERLNALKKRPNGTCENSWKRAHKTHGGGKMVQLDGLCPILRNTTIVKQNELSACIPKTCCKAVHSPRPDMVRSKIRSPFELHATTLSSPSASHFATTQAIQRPITKQQHSQFKLSFRIPILGEARPAFKQRVRQRQRVCSLSQTLCCVLVAPLAVLPLALGKKSQSEQQRR